MSGGSWDYFYHRLDEVSARLGESKDPRRRALGSHVALLARAMHDVEWVDSGDYGDGDDHKAIDAVLGKSAPGLVLQEVRKDFKRLSEELSKVVALIPEDRS